MSNKLKIMCATLVITLMPMGSMCYAKSNTVTTDNYKSIWVEADKKEEKKTMNSEEEVKELSLAEMLELSKDQERCNQIKGKEVCMKVTVSKVEKTDDYYCIITKDGMLKKGEFKIAKEENMKITNIKKGNEIVLQGVIKELSSKKVVLENTKIVKMDAKDTKCKNKEQNKKDCEKNNEHKNHKHHNKDCEIKKDKKDCNDVKEKKNEDKKDCENKKRNEENEIDNRQE